MDLKTDILPRRSDVETGILLMPMPSTKTQPFFGGFAQFLHNFLLFESAMTSEDIMVASLNIIGGQVIEGIFKKQKIHTKIAQNCRKLAAFFVEV